MNTTLRAPAAATGARAYLVSALTHPHFLFYCFVLHLLLRAAVIYLLPSAEPSSDAAWYFGKGVDLSAGLGYLRDGEPTAFWPVGYPAFLGLLFYLFGPSLTVALTANLVLAGISFVLLYAMARRLSGDESVARLTVLLYALYPNAIGYSGLLLTETLFTTLLLLACWSYLRQTGYYGALLTGIAFGVATLVKTQTILIPLALIGFAFLFDVRHRFSSRLVLRGAIVVTAMLVTLAPWSLRNYQVFGEFVLVSTNGGVSLLAGNNPAVLPDYRTDFVLDHPLVHSTGHPDAPEVEVNRSAKRLAVEWIQHNPDRFLALIPHKLWRLWAPDGESEWGYQDMGAFYDDHRAAFRAVRILNQGYYGLLILGAAVFPIVYFKRGRDAPSWIWLGYLLALYLSAISVVFSGQSRYHFPVMPFLIVNAAYVLHRTALLTGRTHATDSPT